MPLTFAARKTVGGNAHENWALLRLVPLIIGERIPENEPAWLILLNLKDKAELVFSPVDTDLTICFLESKISEHGTDSWRFSPRKDLFRSTLAHYPQLIKAFGPLVSLWTMRFEAKHSFFKRVVRHTHSFRNIMLSLAVKHSVVSCSEASGNDCIPSTWQ